MNQNVLSRVISGSAERAARHSLPAIFILIAAASRMVGCDVKVPGLPGGLADRCADIMKGRCPGPTIDIDKGTSESPSLDKIMAHVNGTRTDMLEGSPMPRDLTVECEFTNGVLTAFRWTKGGPQQRP